MLHSTQVTDVNPQQVLVSQTQEDYDYERPQHFKNDTIQFEMLHSTQVSDVPLSESESSTPRSVCSHSTSIFNPSLVSLRAVSHTKKGWKCPMDDLVNK